MALLLEANIGSDPSKIFSHDSRNRTLCAILGLIHDCLHGFLVGHILSDGVTIVAAGVMFYVSCPFGFYTCDSTT